VERLTIIMPPELMNRLRNAAYWSPGDTLTGIAARAVEAEIDRLEHERGESFPDRAAPLRAGRPPRK
jgi:hypothetical protein